MAAPTKPCDVKILLANPEPSTHGTSETYGMTPGSPLAAVIRTLSGRRRWLMRSCINVSGL
jgi:hypothetical protein